jgi:arginine deiminase
MGRVGVSSEIDPLRAVLVHAPGNELRAVTPENREAYLYDDIVDLELAEREHRRLVSVLERFAEVHHVQACVTEMLERSEARSWLVSRMLDVVPSQPLARRLSQLPVTELVQVLIEGSEEEPGPIARGLNETGYDLPPLPNLFFTRDVGVVINEDVVISAMRHGVRWSEELLVKALFNNHPAFAHEGILYDGSEERRHGYSLEGGDVHPLRSDLLVLGFSERSSPAALDHLCELVFARGSVTDVVVVVLPNAPTAVHLDMVFTQVDRELCVVYPPHFIGPERLPVLHRRKGRDAVRQMPNFFAALRAVDLSLEPILCGGEHRTAQDREQWASACNFFTVRPGVALGYARNEGTLAEMGRAGFRVLPAVDFLTGDQTIGDGDRAVITLGASELVRGGGGPRCMTLPLRRESA